MTTKYNGIYAKIKMNGVGQLHCEDGPADINSYGISKHYINGVLHREGAPAIYDGNEYEEWHYNGQLHNPNGPAVIIPNFVMDWYVYGVFVDKHVFRWMDQNDIRFPLSEKDLILFRMRWL